MQRFQQVGFENLARRFASVRFFGFGENFNHLLFRSARSLYGNFRRLFVLHQTERAFHQIAHHALYVLADVTDFGIFGCLYLNKRRFYEFGKAARDLCFADARRTFHDNIFGRDLLAQFRRKLRPSVSVSECNGNRLFRLVLPDNVLIEFVYDLFG